MKWLLTTLFILLLPHVCMGTTYYIRTDGGTPTQCTGLVDAAYPGSGTAQDCAWEHPFWMLSTPTTWRIASGDTVIISNESYQLGYGAPATGSGGVFDASYETLPRTVHFPSFSAISGVDADNKTKIVGADYATGCSDKPELWGSGGAYYLFNVTDTSNIEMNCLEITDHDECGYGLLPSSATESSCETATASSVWAKNGFEGTTVVNFTLDNMDIHGLASAGLKAGPFTNFEFKNSRMSGMPLGNFDFDAGAGHIDNPGPLTFSDFEISWAGCIEKYPVVSDPTTRCVEIVENNSDGVGTNYTGGQWTYQRGEVLYNAQDGIDMLYLLDTGAVTVDRVKFQGNAGNALKISSDARAQNNIIVGDCSYLADTYGANFHNVECRGVATVATNMLNGEYIEIYNNTITQASNLYSPLLMVCNAADCDSLTTGIVLKNNIFIGDGVSNTAPQSTSTGYSAALAQGWENNLWYGLRSPCPYFTGPTGSICAIDPMLADDTISATFNATITSSSPAYLAGVDTGLLYDFYGTARTSIMSVGAVEVAGSTDGLCGSNNGGSFTALTSGDANNCTNGTVTSFTGSGPWTWQCVADTTAYCSASLLSAGGGSGQSVYSPSKRVNYSATKFVPYKAE